MPFFVQGANGKVTAINITTATVFIIVIIIIVILLNEGTISSQL